MSKIDLSALRMDGPAPAPPRNRRLLAPAFALVAVALLVTFLLPLLRPARAVRTAAVRASAARADMVATAEAAGWIEPDPFAVVARPLVKGVLAELPVLEGHPVKAGETVVARLESAELLAARDRAKATVALREAEVALALTEHEVAASLLEQKADVRAEFARAKGELAAAEARLGMAGAEAAAAEAAKRARLADVAAQEKLLVAGGSYPVALEKARAALAEAEAVCEAKVKALDEAGAERMKARMLLDVAEDVLGDPRGLSGAVTSARERLARVAAERDAAAVELSIAERELAWAVVRAPIDGVVLRLLSAPGAIVGPEGEGIVSFYDPSRLQARVDVPLGLVGGVRAGQEVEVSSEVLGSRRTKGVVLRVQRESDLLKNTLQVKVRLIDPDPLLRPETLCRARFLAPPREGGHGGAAPGVDEGALRGEEQVVFRVPREALRGDAVFVMDPTGPTGVGRARRVAVEKIGEEGADVLVKGGLSATHRAILEAVDEGERVKEVVP